VDNNNNPFLNLKWGMSVQGKKKTMELTRRSFIKTSALLALGSSGCGMVTSDPYGRFRMGVATFALRNFPGPQAVAMTRELGADYIELVPNHSQSVAVGQRDKSIPVYHDNPAAWSAVQQALQQHQIDCYGYGAQRFSEDAEQNRAILTWAKQVGVRMIFTSSSGPEMLDVLEPMVEEFGIAIAIHNHGPEDKRNGKISQVAAAMQGRHPLIGACVDTGHYYRASEDPAEAIMLFGDRVHGVHLKDYNEDHDKAGPDWRQNRVPVGDGVMDIPAILKALRKIRYNGVLSLETAMAPENPMPGLRSSLSNLRDMFAAL
jgi:sugar phosphate isomerase/epimerase